MTRKIMYTLILVIATFMLALGSLVSLYWYAPQH